MTKVISDCNHHSGTEGPSRDGVQRLEWGWGARESAGKQEHMGPGNLRPKGRGPGNRDSERWLQPRYHGNSSQQRLLLPKRVQAPDGSMGTGLWTKDWGTPLESPAQTSC